MIALRRHIAWVLVAALASSAVHAQPSAPTASEQREAAEHNKRGLAAVRRSDAEAARLEFLQAYAVVPSAKTLWNLLLAEMDSNRPLDALKHLKKYMADPTAEPKKKERAQGLLAELNARVGHVVVEAPREAVVMVDGVSVGNDERKDRIDVAPGKHVVEAAFEQGSQRREVDVAVGQDVAIRFEAPPKPPAPLPAPPIPAPAPANAGASASEGSHGGIGPPPTATLIFGGIALAALGTGMGFSLAAQSQKDEVVTNIVTCFNPGSSECAHVRDAEDSGRRNSTIAWIAYGAAGAWLIAGGVVWAVSSKSKPSTERTHVVPVAGAGIAGLRLQTSF